MLLEIRQLETGYGKKQVLFDVSMEIADGEIVAIIGPNGAGKSTVLKATCGLLPAWKGNVILGGNRITGSTPARNVSRGLTFCPQGNRVFSDLSVRENLEIGGYRLPRRELRPRIEEVLELFPALKDRLRQNAGTLSGGEQQILALARAMIPQPKLLMLDEPSLGLAPGLVDDVFELISRVAAEQGVSILIVEQKVRKVLDLSGRVYALKLGEVAFAGESAALKEDGQRLRDIFL